MAKSKKRGGRRGDQDSFSSASDREDKRPRVDAPRYTEGESAILQAIKGITDRLVALEVRAAAGDERVAKLTADVNGRFDKFEARVAHLASHRP